MTQKQMVVEYLNGQHRYFPITNTRRGWSTDITGTSILIGNGVGGHRIPLCNIASYSIEEVPGQVDLTDLAESADDTIRRYAKELERVHKEITGVHQTQGAHGNWNFSDYMRGMYNGLELALCLIEQREPQYRESPDDGYLCDRLDQDAYCTECGQERENGTITHANACPRRPHEDADPGRPDGMSPTGIPAELLAQMEKTAADPASRIQRGRPEHHDDADPEAADWWKEDQPGHLAQAIQAADPAQYFVTPTFTADQATDAPINPAYVPVAERPAQV